MHENFHLTCSVVHFADHLLARCIACHLSLSARVVDTIAFQDSGFNPGAGLQAHRRNPDVSIQGVVAVINQALRRIRQGGSPIRGLNFLKNRNTPHPHNNATLRRGHAGEGCTVNATRV